MSTHTETAVRMSRVIKASPAKVFEAWTSPELMKKWAAPEGVAVVNAVVDLRVGGRYHIHMKDPEGKEYNAVGEYSEIDPPRKLQYTWQWQEPENDVGITSVTVEFNDMGDTTEISLVHDRFPNAEAAGGHNEGWVSCLNRLEQMF